MKLFILSFLILLGCNNRPAGPFEEAYQYLLKNQKFSPCPPKSNCYSSFGKEGSEDFFFPIKRSLPSVEAQKKMISILTSLGGVIEYKQENYLHATFTSSVLKRIDDVEVYFGAKDFIHLKSISRSGLWDMGANKRRLNDITFNYIQSR